MMWVEGWHVDLMMLAIVTITSPTFVLISNIFVVSFKFFLHVSQLFFLGLEVFDFPFIMLHFLVEGVDLMLELIFLVLIRLNLFAHRVDLML